MKKRVGIKLLIILSFIILLNGSSITNAAIENKQTKLEVNSSTVVIDKKINSKKSIQSFATHTHTDACYGYCTGVDYNNDGVINYDDCRKEPYTEQYGNGYYYICRSCNATIWKYGQGWGYSTDEHSPHNKDYTKLSCGYTLVSITATNPNQSVKYGGSIIATATKTYANGITSVENCTYSGFNANSVSTQKVTLSYTENGITKTTQITVTVTNELTSINAVNPEQTIIQGGSIDAKAYKTYLNGARNVVDCTYSGFDKNAVSNQTVTLSYTEGGITKTTSILVHVLPITYPHTHTDACYGYCTGVDYNHDGVINYDDCRKVSWSEAYSDGYDYFCQACGAKIWRVGNSRDGSIDIRSSHNRDNSKLNCGYTLASITATKPNQTVNYGGSIIATATATYANGVTTVVNCTYSGFNANTVSTQNVTLTYTQGNISKTTQIVVKVNNYLASIAPVNPEQSVTQGSTIDTKAYATYANGAINVVNCTFSGFDKNKISKQTVTLSYTEGGIIKTSNFSANVISVTYPHTHTDNCYGYCSGIDYNKDGLINYDDCNKQPGTHVSSSGYTYICRACGAEIRSEGGTATGSFDDKYSHKRDKSKLNCNYNLTSITATNPNQTIKQGGSIIKTATMAYANGITRVVECSYSGLDANSLSTQTVTLSYTEGGITKTTQISVTVTYGDDYYPMCIGEDYNGDGYINDDDCETRHEGEYTIYTCRACKVIIKKVRDYDKAVTEYPHNRNFSILLNTTLTSITAVRPNQTVNKGKPVSVLANATFANGVKLLVQCEVTDYDANKLALQKVKLSYTYRGVTQSTVITVNIITGHVHTDACYDYCTGIDYNGDGVINFDDLESRGVNTGTNTVYNIHVCRVCGAVIPNDAGDNQKYYHEKDRRVPTCLEYTIAPSVSVSNITAKTVLSDENVTLPLKINICDNENDTLTCEYYLDGKTTPDGSFTEAATKPQKTVEFPNPIKIADLSEGEHTLKVIVKDNISPVKETILIFRVDKSAPTITTSSVEAFTKGVKLTVAAKDTIGGLAPMAYRYTINGKTTEWLTTKSYKVENLTPSTSYTYTIEVKDNVGHIATQSGSFMTKAEKTSASTSTANKRMLIADSKIAIAKDLISIKAVAKSQTKIYVSWDNVDDAVNYELKRETVTAEGDITKVKTVKTIVNPYYMDNGVEPNTTYQYSVRSENQYGKFGEWSEVVTVKSLSKKPAQVSAVTGSAISSTLNISWDKVDGAEGYDVKVNYDGTEKTTRTNTNHASIDTGIYDSQCDVKVSAYNSNGNGEDSDSIIIYTQANVPIMNEITGKKIADNSIQVQWNVNGNPDTVSYILDIFDGDSHIELSDELKDLPIIDGNITYNITDLDPDIDYTFKVRACSSNHTLTEWSQEVQAGINTQETLIESQLLTTMKNVLLDESMTLTDSEVKAATGSSISVDTDNVSTDKITLSAPKVVVTVSGSAITLDWNKCDGATAYQVEENGKVVYTGTDTSYTHTGLPEKTKYVYRVRSEKSGVYSKWSTSVTAVTKKTSKVSSSSKKSLTANEGKLKVPLNVVCIPAETVSAATGSAIQIKWDKVDGATSYEIIDNNNTTHKTNENSIIIENLIPGVKYKFKVRAVKNTSKGNYSSWVAVTPIVTIPKNITVKAENGLVVVSWDKVGGAATYQLEMNGSLLKPTSTNSMVFKYSDFYMKRVIRVRACNDKFNSNWSKEVIFDQALPVEVAVAAGDEFTVTLPVKNVENVDQYKLTLTYLEDELELVDACDITPEAEIATTYIEKSDTNITIEQAGSKKTVTLTMNNKDGNGWTGIAGRIKFKSKVTGKATLTYGVTLK